MSKKNKAKETSPAAAPQKKEDSRVEHPSYYNAHPSGVECIDIVRHYNFNVGNVIKYLWRHGLKREEGMNNKAKHWRTCVRHVSILMMRLRDWSAKLLRKTENSVVNIFRVMSSRLLTLLPLLVSFLSFSILRARLKARKEVANVSTEEES